MDTGQCRAMPRRAASELDEGALAALLKQQAGVVSRAQLHRESALDAHGMTRDREPRSTTVSIMVDASRRVVPVAGVTIERVAGMDDWVMPNRTPPRARFEYAVLKAASDRDEAGAIALLSDAVHQGLTTAERLVETLEKLVRLPGRASLLEVLEDVAAGTRSVLERRYLDLVERAHGLPEGERQVREEGTAGITFRDVAYCPCRTLVELDGAFGHRDAVDRWADLQRDLEAAEDNQLTLRPGWAQVLEPCRLAELVARVLRSRGWDGAAHPCGPDCTLTSSADHGVLDPTYGPPAPPSLSTSA